MSDAAHHDAGFPLEPSRAPDAGGEIRTISFVSLGCPKNLVDSEKMLGLLAADGLIPVSAGEGGERWDDSEHTEGRSADETMPGATRAATSSIDEADAVVINTCGFLEASKDESLSVIHEAIRAKEAGRIKRVVVAGCLVQRHRAKMLEWAPGIDALIGVFDRDHIVEAVRGIRRERSSLAEASDQPRYWVAGNALEAAQARGMATTGLTVHGKDGKGVGYFEDDSARLRLTPRHYAYLRVSEGCNQRCAFCTIPSIRGKMRSKPIDAIVREARELVRDGAFELNLIGQDTTSYGDDVGAGYDESTGRGGMPAMLREIERAVQEEGGRGWVRLMYAYPSNFRDEFIDSLAEMASRGIVLPYIDIPLQHASDAMLQRMRRHVAASQQRELIEKLRERVPGMAVRTTFISGHPGETEADHEELLAFVEDMQFDAVGVFEYSREPQTPSGTMEQDASLAVDAETKRRRKGEVMALQQKIAFEQAAFLASQFDEKDPEGSGCQFDVLIDRATGSRAEATSGVGSGGMLYQGRAYFQAPQIDAMTYVQAREGLSPGELVRCTVVASDGYDLIARPVSELTRRVSLRVV
ncbi:MAG: 30S ribosomal protein S12 methylthiotransferase RimO [Phycisphaerales bacterium]|jgi:ribosomal protein S12 methylthiotransferase|nr:30S ribosomal protein S12 methylthiotransferase RimO [Phycisphaerales bacterium]